MPNRVVVRDLFNFVLPLSVFILLHLCISTVRRSNFHSGLFTSVCSRVCVSHAQNGHFRSHHLEIRLNYIHQMTHSLNFDGLTWYAQRKSIRLNNVQHQTVLAIFHATAFGTRNLWLLCALFGCRLVSVKIVLNHEHIILFHFHSLFMASDSFRRHGHLCLCFMVFRLQFFAWNKENGTQWNVPSFSTGWYKLELFTLNLMHCVWLAIWSTGKSSVVRRALSSELKTKTNVCKFVQEKQFNFTLDMTITLNMRLESSSATQIHRQTNCKINQSTRELSSKRKINMIISC